MCYNCLIMRIIDGKALSAKMQESLADKIAQMSVTPALLVILVGSDPASQVYVNGKAHDAKKIGIRSETLRLPDTISETELLEIIEKYNQDPAWHGILVQLPLPKHIDEQKILESINPDKDVDGFHPINMGKLWTGSPVMVPSTPAGVMEMLKEYQVEISGKRAVVIGRSNIVGKPMAQMLMDQNATVTIAHSKTPNLAELCREADILVAAIGRDRMITADYIKPGAVVIDVGMNRDENGKLHGDVDFETVKEVASLITPVPGGVGLMTRTMLMEQTVRAAERLQ